MSPFIAPRTQGKLRRYQRRSRRDTYHALWIDPTNPQRMIFGSDQGAGVSVGRRPHVEQLV